MAAGDDMYLRLLGRAGRAAGLGYMGHDYMGKPGRVMLVVVFMLMLAGLCGVPLVLMLAAA